MREIIENNIEIDLALKMWEIFNKSNIKQKILISNI